MFCKKCGAQLEDNAVFCGNCGAKMEETPVPAPTSANVGMTQQVTVGNKGKSSGAGKIVAIVFVVIVLLVAIVAIVKGNKKINLNKYMTVEFSGYETKGNATWVFDSDSFEKDYGKKLKLNESKLRKEFAAEGYDYDAIMSWGLEEFTPIVLVEESISGTLSQTSDLSNGDEIVFTWNEDDIDELSEYCNYKFKYSDMDFTVSDLEEMQTFDPFEGISIVYTGIAPVGRAEISNQTSGEVYQYINYTMDKSNALSNGDTITVTASCNYGKSLEDYAAENFGMIPSETTKTYTVEGLGKYVSELEEISDTVLTSMQQQGVDVLNARAATWRDEVKISSISYLGSYLLTTKNTDSYGNNNMLTLVFKVSVSVDSDEKDVHDKFSYYYPVTFYNIIKLEDETISVDLSDYDSCNDSFTKSYDFGSWWNTDVRFEGYEKLDTLFNKKVTANVEQYSYVSNVEDSATE